jgi:hypothetical protein
LFLIDFLPAEASNSGVAVSSKLVLSELLVKLCEALPLALICLLLATAELTD